MPAPSANDLRRRLMAVVLGPWAGWLLAGIMLVVSMAHFSSEVQLDQGHDLRNRIVGVRALEQGLDPYDLHALANGQVPAPELTDPFSWEVGFSASTASPLILQFYRLCAQGDWRHIHLFWLCLEWGAFILTVVLMATCAPSRRQAGWIAFLLTGLFGGSAVWLMHLWFGQYYIFVALLFAAQAWLLVKGRGGPVARGFLLGLAIPFRPFLLAIMPALWILGARRHAVTACLLGVGMIGASVMAQPSLWASYARLTDRWVAFYVDENPDKVNGPFALQAQEVAAQDGYRHPPTVHRGPVTLLFKTGINVKVARWRQELFAPSWKRVTLPVLALIGLTLTVIALRRRGRAAGTSFALLCCAPVLTDMAVPVASSYNLVMGIPAIAYVALTAIRHRLWIMLPALGPLYVVLQVPTLEFNTAAILVLVGLVTFARPLLLRLQTGIGGRFSPQPR